MSLLTGKRIHGYIWDELPIGDDVIERVHELALEEKQPELVDGMSLFEWSNGEILEDDNNNIIYNTDNDKFVEMLTADRNEYIDNIVNNTEAELQKMKYL